MNREILRLAIPNILTNLTVPLVSLVDVALMGRMPSTFYIVAIGLGTLVFNFLYWAFGFLRMGTTGMVSQAFGREDKEAQIRLLQKGLTISLLGGILIILFQWPLRELALQILSPENEVLPLLSRYIDFRIWAAPATISVFVLTGWLLGMQDSRSALYLALVINGSNAILSVLFVYGFGYTIGGVAIGTVLAQFLGFIFGLILLARKYDLGPSKILHKLRSNLREGKAWKEFISVNSDIMIRTLCLIFTLSFFKAKAANIDPILGAANILLLEFISISAYGIDGFAFAAEAISGKYFGKQDRVNLIRSIKLSFFWGFLIAILLAATFYLFGYEILSILTDKVNVVEKAMPYLPWLILAPLVNMLAFIWDGVYIGTTTSASMRNTMLISTFLIFLPAYFYFFDIYHNHGLWLSLTLFMLARGILLSLLFKPAVLDRIS
ncbi:MAG: MATE family efflux transporter [Flavobacteriales bacterium]|nr:MATE family efflux transporter [Flavobacteriales bacterium]